MNKQFIKQYVKNKYPVFFERLHSIKFKRLYKYQVKLAHKNSPEALVKSVYNRIIPKEHNYGLNLENPVTFYEKINWLKLNYYDPDMIICSDKYLVRKYVEEKGLGHMLNELYAVYDSPDEIDFSVLPEKFVMKATHDSGHVILCEDKKIFNEKLAKVKLRWWLQVDYSYMSGEWPYHTKHPRIICEKFLEDHTLGELVDYKFYCFGGKPHFCLLVSDRAGHAKADFYSNEWKKLPIRVVKEPSGKVFPRPEKLDEMLDAAEILSAGFPFVRVDFYQVDGKVYFGELTFFDSGGVCWFEPEEADKRIGDLLVLPEQTADPWEKIL